jgi:3,4-dihydroxy-2-butanone 4-phosphate synthase
MTKTIRIAKGARAKRGPFASIEDAVAAIRCGQMIIVCDDEDRENEGDLTIAAEKITPAAINFMAKYGRGQICLSMTGARLDELEIPLAVNSNTTTFGTAFCVPIDWKRGGTGISAVDRAATVLAAIDPATKPSDGAHRSDGGRRRSCSHGRSLSSGRHLRNHERRRHDGSCAGADEGGPQARPADDHDRGSDPVPNAQ